MRKRLLITVIAALFLLLAGCSGGDGQRSGIGFGNSNSGGSGGSSGINLDFADVNIQPQKGYQFSLLMQVENNQRHAVSDLKIRPTGFDWGYVSGLNNEYNVDIASATDSSPGYYSLNMPSITLSGFTGDFNWDPVFKYCYTAKSVIRSEVCVPNSLGQCDKSASGSSFSNGPLRITVDNIVPLGEDTISIDFKVSNSLNGNIVNECFQSENLNQFGNEFSISNMQLGSASGNCEPTSSNKYEVNDGSSEFNCKFSRGGSTDSFITQLSAEITYKYQQEMQERILVRDLNPDN